MEVHAVKSWFHRGEMVELEDDVLGVVQRVKELGEGRLRIYWNEQSSEFDLVEHCLDGIDRLVFSVNALDQRVVDRLLAADHWGGENPSHRDEFRPESEDYASQVDRDNEELLSRLDEESRERVREAGERLAWALEEDGKGLGASILVPKDVNSGADDTRGLRRRAPG